MVRNSIGVVVGTYGGLPYVHLQLEQWRRFNEKVGLLVHDDCSERGAAIEALCNEYRADFIKPPKHLGHSQGDVSSFCSGLRWAETAGMRTLVKLSQRWVPRKPFARKLDEALGDKYVLSSIEDLGPHCGSGCIGVRSECFSVKVAEWLRPDIMQTMECYIEVKYEPYVECAIMRWLHLLARISDGSSMVAPNDVLGPVKGQPSPNYLWHNCNSPADYLTLSKELGLKYELHDFEGYLA